MADMNSGAMTSALPDPQTQAAFYSGVAPKRLLAWIFDVILISVATAIIATLPLFIGWFFLPVIYITVSFFYRWIGLTNASATLGQRLFNLQFRNNEGAHLTSGEALLHTLGYLVSTGFFLPQLISLVLILMSGRGQALHDLLAGVALINRPSKY